jgi:CRISPR-associated protein Cas1
MQNLFLTGYGLSISVKNTRLVFKHGINDPFSKQSATNNTRIELPVSACNFDKVIIQGKGHISTDALQILAENNINVIMLDKRGKLFGYFNQIRGSDPLIRQKQYDCFRDEAKVDYLRKWIVREKLQSQIQLFKEIISSRYAHLISTEETHLKFKQAIAKMSQHLDAIERIQDLREILHHESSVSKIYYPTFSLLIRSELQFSTRNNLRNFRPNNASDVINGLLNYGFAILYCEITKQLNALGLDCYYGFYHRNHESHLALVYDMIEPFRHIIDRSILEIQNHIGKNDYVFSRQGIVVLSHDLKRKYIELLSKIFDRKRNYKAPSGIRRGDGYQRMEEITIMKMTCVELKEFVLTGKLGKRVQIRAVPQP